MKQYYKSNKTNFQEKILGYVKQYLTLRIDGQVMSFKTQTVIFKKIISTKFRYFKTVFVRTTLRLIIMLMIMFN